MLKRSGRHRDRIAGVVYDQIGNIKLFEGEAVKKGSGCEYVAVLFDCYRVQPELALQ